VVRSTNVIFIEADGTVRGIHSTLTEDLISGTRRRASHVEPVNRALRWLFHQIRSRTSDDSFVASFTRKWPCRWQARIFNGPTLGPFRRRQEAIAAEISYINSQLEENRL
jgi:hypothetical protein